MKEETMVASLWRLRACCLLLACAMPLWMLVVASPLAQTAPPAGGAAGAQPSGLEAQQPSTTAQLDLLKMEQAKYNRGVQRWVVRVSIWLLVALTIALFIYLLILRDSMSALSANDPEAKKLYFQMALGVPDGTIRSALALLIVFGALLSLIAAVGGDLGFTVPEGLTGVFGTILGFYFGRAGQTDKAMATAAISGATASAEKAQRDVVDARKTTQEAQQQLASVKSDQAQQLAAEADTALDIMSKVAAPAPGDVGKSIQDALTAARTAVDDAKRAGTPEAMKSALTQIAQKGPTAVILDNAARGLAPLAQPNLTASAAARAIIDLSLRLPPSIAPCWTARLLRAPYREGLIAPVIDDAYAKQLMSTVSGSDDLFARLKAQNAAVTPADAALTPAGAALTPADFVRLVLREDAAASIAERLNLPSDDAGVAATVGLLQQRALEFALTTDIDANEFKVWGGSSAFFAALDKVQASADGLKALDLLMMLVRQARSAGIAASDLLPS
jgi:hypothetical protein